MYSFVVMVMFLHIDDCGGLKPVGPNKVFANSFFYGITFLFPMVSTPETLLRPASAENFKRKKANENDKNNLQRM